MNIQAIVAYIIVSGAVYYVGKELWDQCAPLRKDSEENADSTCGKCNACGTATKQSDSNLLKVGKLPARPGRRSRRDEGPF